MRYLLPLITAIVMVYIGYEYGSRQDTEQQLEDTKEIQDVEDACPDSLGFTERLHCVDEHFGDL